MCDKSTGRSSLTGLMDNRQIHIPIVTPGMFDTSAGEAYGSSLHEAAWLSHVWVLEFNPQHGCEHSLCGHDSH